MLLNKTQFIFHASLIQINLC